METVPGQNRLLLTCRRGKGGMEILRVRTSDSVVVLPDTLRGLKVTALGGHAFSPNVPEPEGGERILVTPGFSGDAEEGDMQKVRSVTLPDTLQSLGDYAFFGCSGLRELHFSDTVGAWGSCIFMNCPCLDRFFLRLSDEKIRTLSYLANDLPREIDVSLSYPDGGAARLIFPEYWESYEENLPAKVFDYHIYGGGYPYRNCFRERMLLLSDYDALFPTLLGMEHEEDCVRKLAFYRLRWPRDLSPAAKDAYLRYLRGRTGEVLRWLLEENDFRGLAFFLPLTAPSLSDLTDACALARNRGASEAVALLLEEKHRRFPPTAEKRFEL